MPQLPSEYIDAETLIIESVTETDYSKYSMNIQTDKDGDPHQWQVEFRTPKHEPIIARGLNAFLNSLGGRHGVFTLPEPLPLMGAGLDDLTVSSCLKGDNTATVSTSRVGELAMLAGDFFKFSNHDKAYQCSENYLTGGELSFYPSARVDATGATIEPCVFSLRLKSDVNSLNLDALKYNVSTTVVCEENV